MYARFKVVGFGLVIAGLAFVGIGGYTYSMTEQGARSLSAFSAAQNVKLSYNEQGQLLDHGDAASGQAILDLLQKDWGYTINAADLNPNDPVVNTATEYMVQMATISNHTLDSTVKVTLDKDVTADDGTVFKAGTYDFAVDGRYYSQFDRTNPIEAQARTAAWSPLALSLIGELGVGAVTASTLQVGLGIAAIAAALGATLILAGFGIVWAARPMRETVKATATRPATVPAAI